MPFETLKRSHLKRNILIGVVVIAIISAVVLQFTRAKYIFTDKMPLINGTVNYSPYDITVTSKLLVGEDTTIDLEEIPTSSNVSLVSATCTNDAVLTWNASENGYEVSNLTHKGTKCEAIYALMNSEASQEFDYTGNIQTFVAQQSGNYRIEAWGASGGDIGSYTGGKGAYTSGNLYLEEGDTLYVVVGGAGSNFVNGGYNGGGSLDSDQTAFGSSGGGATDIRTYISSDSAWDNFDSLKSRIMVAAGGGGANNRGDGYGEGNGGSGGTLEGKSGISTNNGNSGYGYGIGEGGTQISGGQVYWTERGSGLGSTGYYSSGTFGKTELSPLISQSGGGSGYYGGASSIHSGGGGGSSFVSGCSGCNAISEDSISTNITHTNQSEHYSGYIFSNIVMLSGDDNITLPDGNTANGNTGNGYAKISLIDYSYYRPQFNVNVEENNGNITVTITPNADNLFATSKYYFSINNNEYIESTNNTYTFESMDVGDYEIKTYIVDEKGLESEIETQSISIREGITIADIINSHDISTRTDFSTPLTANTTGTIYQAEDDDGTTYYFAGAVDDNWVKFGQYTSNLYYGYYSNTSSWYKVYYSLADCQSASSYNVNCDLAISAGSDMYWRIIRFNGDGSIRLIYQGTSANTTETGTQIGKSAFNSSWNNNMYVGYMYTENEVHGLDEDSSIKEVLDTWYQKNLLNYANYIDTNAGFCGDRTPYIRSGTEGNYSFAPGGGTGGISTYYGATIRLSSYSETGSVFPNFKCNDNSDLYTIGNSSKGNKALTYPIGLITADEVIYAGAEQGYNANNTNYYLYTGLDYWTMSPQYFSSVSPNAYVFYVTSTGSLFSDSVHYTFDVRPVINLKADTLFEVGGTGTSTNPYVVKGAS